MARGGEPFWLRQRKGQAAAARVMGAVLWRALHPWIWEVESGKRESERGR